MVVKFILFCCFAILATSSLKSHFKLNQTRRRENHGRLFSLFSIVQFPNDACASSSTTYPNGTCLTSSECSSKSGSASGGCAAGFGVCCVFSSSTSGSSLSNNCTYITNPNYPADYTTGVTTQTFTIQKCSADVCRIRLDYEEFVLTAPELIDVATDGQCIIDRLVFTTTSETTVSSVAPTATPVATYGNYPYICGTNTGQHSYLDLSCTATDTANLEFTLGDSINNKYKIKVTQLSCNDECVASQEGCFQYFTGVTGTITNYNFDGGNVHLASQNYASCIRQEEGYCCIQYKADTFDMPDTHSCADTVGANLCSTAKSCSLDFILIPGAENPSAVTVTASPASATTDRFCGTLLAPGGYNTPAVNEVVKTCQTPFELGFISEKTSNFGAAALGKRGFSISYTQLPC